MNPSVPNKKTIVFECVGAPVQFEAGMYSRSQLLSGLKAAKVFVGASQYFEPGGSTTFEPKIKRSVIAQIVRITISKREVVESPDFESALIHGGYDILPHAVGPLFRCQFLDLPFHPIHIPTTTGEKAKEIGMPDPNLILWKMGQATGTPNLHVVDRNQFIENGQYWLFEMVR